MPPVVIAGAVAGAATIGGAYLSSKAQSKAAKKAAQASQQNNNANNALARENRDFGFSVLDPFRQSGLQAQSVLGGLLYGNPQQPVLAPQQPAPMVPAVADESAWARGAAEAMLGVTGPRRSGIAAQYADDPERQLAYLQSVAHPDERRAYSQYVANNPRPGPMQPATPTQPALQPQGTVTAQPSAWDTFRNSTNYQFRFDEGMKALNHGLAFKSLGDSGAAVKESMKYGQNFASNELGNYINLLLGQQNVGMGAASAMVGVGQNTTNAVMANNTANANNQANAALVQGNATGNMWNGIASGVGQVVGALGSSYGRSTPPTYPQSYTGAWGAGGI
jgi:hypothetical protein